MDKRYQVFVSSTYADLRDERQRVLQTLMEMDCLPAGMELFPAADEEQWAFIKKVIDDCDYYLLLIGGRYGSMTAEGISYTEKEYDYACEKGIHVLAFLHEKPEDISVGKSDIEPSLRVKLDAFRAKVSSGRLVKFWRAADELPGLVALSLTKTIKTYPAVGWVRASSISNIEALAELNDLRKSNAALERELATVRAQAPREALIPDLLPLAEKITLHGDYHTSGTDSRRTRFWSVEVTWSEIFALIAPYVMETLADAEVKRRLAANLLEKSDASGIGASINDQEFQTVKIQLIAHGLVTVERLATTKGGSALFWNLTPQGQTTMMALRTLRAQGAAEGG